MAGKYGPLEVPSWAIGVVFTFFLIITIIWDKMLHAAENWLHKRNKPALNKVLHCLKDEVLAVGMIVLILPLFENHLMKICIPKVWATTAPGYNPEGWDLNHVDYAPNSTPYVPIPYPSSSPDYYATPPPATVVPGGRRLLAPPAPAADSKSTNTTGYKDAATAKKDAKDQVCDDGWTQLFPLEALHGIHIFIALTALVHIFYACLCLTLCTLRMNRWWPWEKEALQTSAIPTSKKIIKSLGKSTAHHVVMSFLNQFILPISRPIYLSLRRLFVEGLKSEAQLTVLPIDFPYFGYVQEAMQYSFCDVVAVSPLTWLFAIIQLIVPVNARIYCSIIICCITILLMFTASAKLHSIVVHLAARSYVLYSKSSLDEHIPDGDKAPKGLDTVDTVDLVLTDSENVLDGQHGDGHLHDNPGKHAEGQGAVKALFKSVKAVFPTGKDKDKGLQQTKQQEMVPSATMERLKTYVARAKTGDDLPSMFWFHRPWLILTMFKIAYFQSAFCLTLVLFALWKENQFLPHQDKSPPIVTFFALLAINIVLSVFVSTCVLPVYAIVSVADKGAFESAGEFYARARRHQAASTPHEPGQPGHDHSLEVEEQQHHHAMRALQKLQSQINRMHNLALEAGTGQSTGANGQDHATSVTPGATSPTGGMSRANSRVTSWGSSWSSQSFRAADNVWGAARTHAHNWG